MEERKKVADAGGAWSGDAPFMTEKTAKELHGFSKEMNEAHKTGALDSAKGIFTSITEVAEGGSLEILKGFFELLAAFVRAGHAEHMIALAKILYSEESIKFWKELTMGIGKANDGVLRMTQHLADLRDVITKGRKTLGITNKHLQTAMTLFSHFINPLVLFASAIEKARKEVEAMIKMLTSIGGGGGGDGDGDGWDWPRGWMPPIIG